MACLGNRKAETETPSLCLDLLNFEANLKQVATAVRNAGKLWRPHVNSHLCPDIALQQIREGAIGITCAKASQAEAFSLSGIRDILIAHLPAGPHRIRRIASLCKTATPIVTCDHYVQAEPLSAECVRQGVRCRVLVDINVGADRTGVRPGRDALELARGIERLPGLDLAGIMGHEGHVNDQVSIDENHLSVDAAMGILSHTRDVFSRNGFCCEIVSAAGSRSIQRSLSCGALTEIQAGSVIFGSGPQGYVAALDDLAQSCSEEVNQIQLKTPHPTSPRKAGSRSRMGTFASGDSDQTKPALTVLATVVSRPGFDRAVLDAGWRAIAADSRDFIVKDWEDARVVMHSSEHIGLELGPVSRELRIGDQVELVVRNPGRTTMLHHELLGFRANRLESIWPILGRDKLV